MLYCCQSLHHTCCIVVSPYTTHVFFLFALLQLSSQGKHSQVEKILQEHLRPLYPPPNLHRRYPICNINLKRLSRLQLCTSFLRPASIDVAVIIFPTVQQLPVGHGLLIVEDSQ